MIGIIAAAGGGAFALFAFIVWREYRNMNEIDLETAIKALAETQDINGWWCVYWTGDPESPTFQAIGDMRHYADSGAAKAIRIISSMGTGILQQGGATRQGPTS